MSKNNWDHLRLPLRENRMWELYHENSKLPTFFRRAYSQEEFDEKVKEINLDLIHQVETKIPLKSDKSSLRLAELIAGSISDGEDLSLLEKLGMVLGFAYGLKEGSDGRIEKRQVHSPGGIPTLEIYLILSGKDEFNDGLYHYSTTNDCLELLDTVPESDFTLAEGEGENNTDSPVEAEASSCTVILTGIPRRSAIFHGERGYRMCLMEAGSCLQNMRLAAQALNIAVADLDDLHERKLEMALEIDGVNQIVLAALRLD